MSRYGDLLYPCRVEGCERMLDTEALRAVHESKRHKANGRMEHSSSSDEEADDVGG